MAEPRPRPRSALADVALATGLALVALGCTDSEGSARATTGGMGGASGSTGAGPSLGGATGGGAGAAGEAPKYWHVDGTSWVDGDGNPTVTRGIGLGNWLLWEGYMWGLEGGKCERARAIEACLSELVGSDAAERVRRAFRERYITEADVARMAELGFTVVRLPLNARRLRPEGGTAYDEEELGYVAQLVAWAKRHGLGVVLDLHAVPGGQTGKVFDDPPVEDVASFFADPAHQDRVVELWSELARRFADEPTVIGYDLLNEPIKEEDAAYAPQLYPFYERLGKAIRELDPHHTLIVEGSEYARNFAPLGPPFDANLVYSFHKYNDEPTLESIQPYLDARERWQRPLWAGELGEAPTGWYLQVLNLLESHQIGWAFWPWKKLHDRANNPYSVEAPPGWDAIFAWSQGLGPAPDRAAAQVSLDTLLTNIELSKCHYNESVTCTLVPCGR